MALFGKKSVIANPNCIQFTICTIIIGRGKFNEIITHVCRKKDSFLRIPSCCRLTFLTET